MKLSAERQIHGPAVANVKVIPIFMFSFASILSLPMFLFLHSLQFFFFFSFSNLWHLGVYVSDFCFGGFSCIFGNAMNPFWKKVSPSVFVMYIPIYINTRTEMCPQVNVSTLKGS